MLMIEYLLSPLSTPGTFPCNTGPFAAHVPMSIHHPQLQHPTGMLTSRDIFPASRTMWFVMQQMSVDSVH